MLQGLEDFVLREGLEGLGGGVDEKRRGELPKVFSEAASIYSNIEAVIELE